MKTLTEIRALIAENRTDEAIRLLEVHLQANPYDDAAYLLLGNVYRKRSDWKHAIECYLSATEINPDSPAREAYRMTMDILNFMNPDLYNP